MTCAADAARYRELVSRALAEALHGADIPPRLRDAMGYSLRGSGKLLRPCLALAACEMLGGEATDALPVACALEMIHTYSLIHDDLPAMDDDDFRRGRPSNHKVFGEGMAILAGDGLLSFAFETMLDALSLKGNDPDYLAALRAVARGAGIFGMVAGQAVDLDAAEADSGERLDYIHSRKTGAMIRAAVLAGAHIAHADAGQIAALSEFGSLYGLLFQITDDILDVEGSFGGMGKTLGKDQAAHKLTYVNLYGLETAKKMAEEIAAQAQVALEPFGRPAEYFLKLTEDTLRRDH